MDKQTTLQVILMNKINKKELELDNKIEKIEKSISGLVDKYFDEVNIPESIEKIIGKLENKLSISLRDDFNSVKQDFSEAINSEIKRVVESINVKDGKNGKDGKDGKDGKNYELKESDKQEIADMVDVELPEITEKTIEEIRDGFESLEAEEKLDVLSLKNIDKLELDASQIKNLKNTGKVISGGKTWYLKDLKDVNLDSVPIVDGKYVLGGGSGGGATSWGSVTGNLSDQTDLSNALALKADVSSLATVATSGDYNDLINKPAVSNGDMLKSVYDTNNDGIVNEADVITNQGALATLNQVDTAEIVNNAVTLDKIESIGTDIFLGRHTTGSGDVQQVSATQARTILNVENGAEVNNISDTDATDLTDSGDSTLHYHSSDRDRANHTGTQTASTISDFQANVSANTDVVANTAGIDASTLIPTTTISSSRALVLSDRNTNIENSASVTVFVPDNATVAFPIGTQIFFTKKFNTLLFAFGAGVTINSVDGLLEMDRINCGATLLKVGVNEWNLIGELK